MFKEKVVLKAVAARLSGLYLTLTDVVVVENISETQQNRHQSGSRVKLCASGTALTLKL